MKKIVTQPLPLWAKVLVMLVMLLGVGAFSNIMRSTPSTPIEEVFAFIGALSVLIGFCILKSENVVKTKPQQSEAYQSAPNA